MEDRYFSFYHLYIGIIVYFYYRTKAKSFYLDQAQSTAIPNPMDRGGKHMAKSVLKGFHALHKNVCYISWSKKQIKREKAHCPTLGRVENRIKKKQGCIFSIMLNKSAVSELVEIFWCF